MPQYIQYPFIKVKQKAAYADGLFKAGGGWKTVQRQLRLFAIGLFALSTHKAGGCEKVVRRQLVLICHRLIRAIHP